MRAERGRSPMSTTSDHERDALQKAYNATCTVLARLDEAGWEHSTLAAEVESIRKQLAKVAFDV